MKLTYRQIDGFVAAPDPAARVILVYGPDQGLVTERTAAICKTIVSDLNDPFNVAHMTTEKITTDPAGFYDETNAQSLMGGQRLILIKQAEDKITPILKDYLNNPSKETLVVVEAGDLGTKSALRKLCEGAKNAAAVPCYVDDEKSLTQIIRDMCAQEGYTVDRDALVTLSSALIGDRSIARNEIEKLLLYKGVGAQKVNAPITMGDVIANYGDVKDWGFDRLVYAVADGYVSETQSIIDSLIKDNTAPIAIIRSVQSHFWRLLETQSKIAAGKSQEEAIKNLTPPLFWKVEEQFKSQLRRWSIPALESVLDALNKAESMMKQSNYSDLALLTNSLVQLARYNPRNRQAV